MVVCLVFAISMVCDNSYVLYASFYVLGEYAGIHLKNNIKRIYHYECLALLFLICSVGIGTILSINLGIFYTIVRSIQVVLIWFCADIMAIDQVPVWWMKLSFFIYVAHRMILESVEKLFLIIVGNNIVGAWLDFMFAPLITMCMIILAAWTFKRIKPLYKLLVGNRV